ncbi:MAG: DUF4058 family protein [Planctomycetes bacterium]|nr:DUF4058 family protein [Planctomycetota bacterium]
MPLLDHFRPPLLGHRHWEGFHGRWAAAISDALNECLPPGYFAEFQVTLGTRIEVDLATLRESTPKPEAPSGSPATAVLSRVWAPPAPAAVIPAVFPDEFEVRVFNSAAGPVLVAAVELVSPGNKDREGARRAFAAKCATYLQRGIGLVVVDIVTSRTANLHEDLLDLLGQAESGRFSSLTPLYATAYRPAHRSERNEIDLWREPLAVSQILPTLPLAVCGLGDLPVDLEGTYMEARRRGRID